MGAKAVSQLMLSIKKFCLVDNHSVERKHLLIDDRASRTCQFSSLCCFSFHCQRFSLLLSEQLLEQEVFFR